MAARMRALSYCIQRCLSHCIAYTTRVAYHTTWVVCGVKSGIAPRRSYYEDYLPVALAFVQCHSHEYTHYYNWPRRPAPVVLVVQYTTVPYAAAIYSVGECGTAAVKESKYKLVNQRLYCFMKSLQIARY